MRYLSYREALTFRKISTQPVRAGRPGPPGGQSRRRGKKAPADRPGGLREKVLAHLRANPGSSFTPHEIHKVNGHSSGAIANALDTLVKHGDAELATEKPRKFRLAGTATAPAPDAGDDTDLAGAA